MTEFRARISVQAIGILSLVLGAGAQATVSDLDITGTQADTDSSCVAPIPFFNGLDCSYNASDPTGFAPADWQGPIGSTSTYYLPGNSPYAQGAVGDVPAVGDPLQVELPFTGTLSIDDGGSACDTGDTLTAEIIMAAGTRAFDGGQGANGEETWDAGDILFPIPATAVDSATVNGSGGCDYVIGSAGFPPRLEEASGGRLYPVDSNVDAVGFYVAPSTIAMASFEGPSPGNVGNIGVAVTVTVGATYNCVDNNSGGACGTGASGGSNFAGARGILENVLVSISTNSSGDITSGEIYLVNESKVFNVPPNPSNSWDGTRLAFTGACTNCKLARDDNYEVIIGATNVDLDIGANDSNLLVNPTAVTIDTALDQGGAVTLNGTPGPIAAVTATYTPAGGPFVETFIYQVDDSSNPPGLATVTINVVPDTLPVAGDVTMTLSTAGVDPAGVTGQFNGLTEGSNAAGNNGVVTTNSAATNGTDSTNGTNVSYAASGTFFSGTDSFSYTITDDQSDADTGLVTVNIADVVPVTSDETVVTDENFSVDIPITTSLGNGSAAQHDFAISSDASSGACVLNTTNDSVTYTPDADFFGADECTYTLTDGDGSAANGLIEITVTEIDDLVIKLPGGGAFGPWTLLLLLGLPLLRRRKNT